jgi:probable HAF family extracellular repeat protein
VDLFSLRGFGVCAFGVSCETAPGETLYTAIPLGSLGGMDTAASGINSSGQITGFSSASYGGSPHGFLYSNTCLYWPRAVGQIAGSKLIH